MAKKFYITTSIPYVNGDPHIGHALEFVQTDVLARVHRQRGEKTFFLTGSDENSLKNVQAAEAEGISIKKLVDRNSQKFLALAAKLSVSNDDFIRTTTKKHITGAQKLWLASRSQDIYKKKYAGLYCVGCERFYSDKELEQGKCPVHQTKPEHVEEENYFFKLSNYQKQLEKIIATDQYKIVPETRKNEVLGFIRGGLEDFSISRSQERAKNWGVPVPNDKEQAIYVWYDALSNYITGLDYAGNGKNFKTFWPADVHVIGKDIIRFHAVYWPAMLLSAGLDLPKTLFVHDFINVEGVKMSKSLGNVVDPFSLIEQFGAEPTRYYLLRYIHPFQESSFSLDHFKEVYTADLANGLGNLVNRVAGLIEQNKLDITLKIPKPNSSVAASIDSFEFHNALKLIWDLVAETDGHISKTKPWELAKAGKTAELKKVITPAAQNIAVIALELTPFLPVTAETIAKIFTAKKIKKADGLFPRLEA